MAQPLLKLLMNGMRGPFHKNRSLQHPILHEWDTFDKSITEKKLSSYLWKRWPWFVNDNLWDCKHTVGSTWTLKKQILCSKWAHFKKTWHILKALSRPCPLGSKLIRFGGFQKGAVCPCSLRGCKVVLCQSLRMSIHFIKNNDSNFDVH